MSNLEAFELEIPYVVSINSRMSPTVYTVGLHKKVPAWVAWSVVIATSALVLLVFSAVLIMVCLYTNWFFVALLIASPQLALRLAGRQGFIKHTYYTAEEDGDKTAYVTTSFLSPREAFARR